MMKMLHWPDQRLRQTAAVLTTSTKVGISAKAVKRRRFATDDVIFSPLPTRSGANVAPHCPSWRLRHL